MNTKSASTARRLFAAIPGQNSTSEVMHKEGKKEKETFPHTPPIKKKKKGKKQPDTDPVRARAYA